MKTTNNDEVFYDKIKTPLGIITLGASNKGLKSIQWGSKKRNYQPKHPILKKTKIQLSEYFEGKRHKFDIPLVIDGTDFQKSAWQALRKIPYGKTISYGQQAKALGKSQAARAVGSANGKNPLPIIIPCHRVITATGKLGGFTGGLQKKTTLLDIENRGISQ